MAESIVRHQTNLRAKKPRMSHPYLQQQRLLRTMKTRYLLTTSHAHFIHTHSHLVIYPAHLTTSPYKHLDLLIISLSHPATLRALLTIWLSHLETHHALPITSYQSPSSDQIPFAQSPSTNIPLHTKVPRTLPPHQHHHAQVIVFHRLTCYGRTVDQVSLLVNDGLAVLHQVLQSLPFLKVML